MGGASANGTISMTVAAGQTLNAIKMTIPAGTVLCADVPPDMQLSDEP